MAEKIFLEDMLGRDTADSKGGMYLEDVSPDKINVVTAIGPSKPEPVTVKSIMSSIWDYATGKTKESDLEEADSVYQAFAKDVSESINKPVKDLSDKDLSDFSFLDFAHEAQKPMGKTATDAYNLGRLNMKQSKMWGDVAFNAVDLKGAVEKAKIADIGIDQDMEKFSDKYASSAEFRKKGVFKHIAEAGAGTANYMLNAQTRGLIGGAVAGGVAFAVTRSPKLARTAGKIGMAVMSGVYTARIETGSIFKELVRDRQTKEGEMIEGVDPDIAQVPSIIGGVINGTIEVAQQALLMKLPGVSQLSFADKLNWINGNPLTKSLFGKFLLAIGKDFPQEIGEEYTQALTSEGAKNAVYALDGLINQKPYAGTSFSKVLDVAGKEAKEAVYGLAPMSIAGGTVSTAINARKGAGKAPDRSAESIDVSELKKKPEDEGQGEDFGKREDGTEKGEGYFGALKRPDGRVSTELSIGVNLDGKEVEIPALVPTLSKDEIDYLLNDGKPTDEIIQKAVDHAKLRISEGKSPFAQKGETVEAKKEEAAPVEEAPKKKKVIRELLDEKDVDSKIGKEEVSNIFPVEDKADSSTRTILKDVKSQIEQIGEAGGRAFDPETREVSGYPSSFPKWFKDKGLNKKTVVAQIDRVLAGKPVTKANKAMLSMLMDGRIEEARGEAKFYEEQEAAELARIKEEKATGAEEGKAVSDVEGEDSGASGDITFDPEELEKQISDEEDRASEGDQADAFGEAKSYRKAKFGEKPGTEKKQKEDATDLQKNAQDEKQGKLFETEVAYGSEEQKESTISAVAEKLKQLYQTSIRRASNIRQFASNKKIDYVGQKIVSPENLATLFQVFRSPSIEHLHFVLLDAQDRIIRHFASSSGEMDYSAVSTSDITAIGKKVKEFGAKKLYVMHNHPSGSLKYSKEDATVTQKIKDIIPEFEAHVIIDSGEFGHFDKSMEYRTGTFVVKGEDWGTKKIATVSNPQSVAESFSDVIKGTKSIHVAYLDKSNHVVAYEAMKSSDMKPKYFRKKIGAGLKTYGAWTYVVLGDYDSINDLGRDKDMSFIEGQSFSPPYPKGLLDVVGIADDGKLLSARENGYLAGANEIKSMRVMEPSTTYSASPIFYSKLLRTIDEKMPRLAPSGQVKGILNSAGVKKEEIGWLGVDEFLEGKDKVSKEELLDFIEQNQVEIKEVVKGDYSGLKESERDTLLMRQTMEAQLSEKFQSDEDKKSWENYDAGGKEILSEKYPDEIAQYERLVGSHIKASESLTGSAVSGESKFPQYVLPGGKNYREVLLALPSRGLKPEYSVVKRRNDYAVLRDGKFVVGGWATEEAAREAFARESQDFKSPHFEEPNILAHIRMNDRTIDGKKTLFIEELQSDWHQAGRQKGYGPGPLSKEAQTRLENLEEKESYPDGGLDEAEQNEIDGLRDKRESNIERGKTGVPDAPFKKTWHELALKRILRMAAEEGYSAIAWTTGEQQADRYDLSKHIEKITHSKNGDGTYNIHVIDKVGNDVYDRLNIPESKVEELVGKEMAKKIAGREGHPREGGMSRDYFKNRGKATGTVKYQGSWYITWEDGSKSGTYVSQGDAQKEGEQITRDYVTNAAENESRVLSGLDLKVGGEGMKTFYDRMIPQFLNKYTKKWGGRVGKPSVESKIGKQDVRYSPNFEVRNAIRRNDHLGFDGPLPAMEAILQHPDFAERWDVDPVDAMIIEGWREDQIGATEKPKVHNLDITQSMKQSVSEGQAMFEPPTEYGYSSEDGHDLEKIESPEATKERQEFKLFERSKEIIRKFAERVGERYVPRGAKGVFIRASQNIRLMALNNLSTVTHEVTHYIDQKHGFVNKLIASTKRGAKIRKRLTDLYVEVYPGGKRNHKLHTRITEGVAVLVQRFVDDPGFMKSEYPDLVKGFLEVGGEYYLSEFAELAEDSKSIKDEYGSLDPTDQVGAKMTESKNPIVKQSYLSFFDKFATFLADNIFPIEKLSKLAGIAETSRDPSLWLRQYKNSATMIMNNIKGNRGYWSFRSGELRKIYDFNWKTIIDGLQKTGQMKLFGIWLVARREHFGFKKLDEQKTQLVEIARAAKLAVEEGRKEEADAMIGTVKPLLREVEKLDKVLKNDGMDKDAVEKVYLEHKNRFAEQEVMFDLLVRADLDLLADPQVQLIKPAQYASMVENEGYATFKRDIYDDIVGEGGMPLSPSRPGGTKASSTMQRVGSELSIINPIFGSLLNHAEITRKALKQTVYNKMLPVAEKMPELFEILPATASVDKHGVITFPQEKDANIIMARKDYKRKPILTDKGVKRVLDEILTYKNVDMFRNILMVANRAFVRGTTGSYPPFAIMNFVVDQITAVALSRNAYIPLYDTFRELLKVVQSRDNVEAVYFEEYLIMGGERQTIVGWQNMSSDELYKRIAREKEGLQKILNFGDKAMEYLAIPAAYSEIATRAVEYIKARKTGKAQIVAMEEAGRVTAPFHHIGSWGGSDLAVTLIKSIPFSNAGIQVLSEYSAGAFTKDRAFKTWAVTSALTGALMVSFAGLLKFGDDDDKEQYANLEAEELARYIWFPNPKGKGLMRLRIPEQMGMWGAAVNMALGTIFMGTKYSLEDYKDAATAWIPDQFDLTDPARVLMSWIPQIAKPAIEVAVGKKTYPEIHDMEGRSLQSLQPKARYYESTTEFAKYVGDKLNVSPIKVDHLIEGYLGRTARFVTGKYNRGPLYAAYDLTKGSIIREFYFTAGRNVIDYYDKRDETTQKYNSFRNEFIDLPQDELETLMWNRALITGRTGIDKMMKSYRALSRDDLMKDSESVVSLRRAILDGIALLK